MALLPNIEGAIFEIRKLADYCLSPSHPRGRHKARVFRQALGIGPPDASWLKEAILAALSDSDATELHSDDQGSRWRVDVPVTRQNTHVVIRTIWIIRTGEQTPRFVTCWVL